MKVSSSVTPRFVSMGVFSFVFLSVSFMFSGMFSGCASSRHQAPPSNPVAAKQGDTSGVNSVAKESKLAQGEIGSDRLSRVRPVVGTKGMVVSDDVIASEWGAEILRRGGNAVDAAVATAFMLSVTRPHYGSLGGGGFLVYCPAKSSVEKQSSAAKRPSLKQAKNAWIDAEHAPLTPECQTIDYRETAPAAASRDMYVKNSKANTDLSQGGALASGVPGVTAGLLTALEKWGTRDRGELLSKPIRLARGGFARTGWMESAAKNRWDDLNEPAKELLGCRDSNVSSKDGYKDGHQEGSKAGLHPCPVGSTIVQPDLTRVLEEISSRGIRGFYHGWVAEKIVDGIRKAGGILTTDDFAHYSATMRAPLEERVHLGNSNIDVVTMPPPSSGGVLLLQMLGYMDRAEKDGRLLEGYGASSSLNAEAHAMSLAFADRAEYLGDASFVKVPLDSLLSQNYLNQRWATFNPLHANPPAGAGPVTGKPEPQYTTHFSVVDGEGNAVAITTTINDEYGSGFVPPGTGIFMNDEMDDFSVQPGVPNMFGLIGGEANAIAAGKRPLSSMTPTIVRENGNVILVLGASGGPRIISSVFNVIVNHFEFGMGLSDAVAAARLHDQWRPNELRVEKFGFSPEVLRHLREMGYAIAESPALAKIEAIAHFPNGRTWGVADPRGEGAAVAQ